MQIDRPASTEAELKADNPGTKNSAQINKPADRELVEGAVGDALVVRPGGSLWDCQNGKK